MIGNPEGVKAERFRPFRKGEQIRPLRGLSSYGTFGGRQVNPHLERALRLHYRIYLRPGVLGRRLVICHNLLLFSLFLSDVMFVVGRCGRGWRERRG